MVSGLLIFGAVAGLLGSLLARRTHGGGDEQLDEVMRELKELRREVRKRDQRP